MATALKFPDPFKFSALNLALEWAQWRQQFEWFILATRKAEKDEEVIVGVCRCWFMMGKVYESFHFTNDNDAKNTVPVLDHFTDYFEPLKSEVFFS